VVRPPAEPLPPAKRRLEALEAQPPQLHGVKKVLDILGQAAWPQLEAAIPGTPGHYQRDLLAAQQAAQEEERQLTQEATRRHLGAQTEEAQARTEAIRAKPEPTPKAPRTHYDPERGLLINEETGEAKPIVENVPYPTPPPMTGSLVPRGAALQLPIGPRPPKSAGHTSPFEAFAYGDANERKAAQEFLALEKQLGARYQRPGEVEQRYAIYKRDPEAYRGMFGREGSDRTHAARMLTYFQRQRDAIGRDFTLDEATKAQRLREIEELERPFLEAAGVGGGPGPGGDRVRVLAPDGTLGTIPRTQLDRAKKKGYRLATQ